MTILVGAEVVAVTAGNFARAVGEAPIIEGGGSAFAVRCDVIYRGVVKGDLATANRPAATGRRRNKTTIDYAIVAMSPPKKEQNSVSEFNRFSRLATSIGDPMPEYAPITIRAVDNNSQEVFNYAVPFA